MLSMKWHTSNFYDLFRLNGQFLEFSVWLGHEAGVGVETFFNLVSLRLICLLPVTFDPSVNLIYKRLTIQNTKTFFLFEGKIIDIIKLSSFYYTLYNCKFHKLLSSRYRSTIKVYEIANFRILHLSFYICILGLLNVIIFVKF